MTGPAADYKIAPSFVDVWKRFALGKPMITDQLRHEKLSNPVALGALSPDAISSTAYGPEQIMVELLPAAGMAAFVLLLPITGVILLILALVAASYRQVVMAYTRAGGSYVVAQGELRTTDRANCGGGTADRLRGHGRHPVCRRDGGGGFRDSGAGFLQPRDHRRVRCSSSVSPTFVVCARPAGCSRCRPTGSSRC